MLDFIIRNARIVDGTGAPAFVGDVGILNGKITFHTRDEARAVIDAAGLTLTPGLIDSHSHNDRFIGLDPQVFALSKISQGITTEVTGQCGSSPFPVPDPHDAEIRGFFAEEMSPEHLKDIERFRDFQTYLTYADAQPKPGNYAFLQGHGMLRMSVMGRANRKPTADELALMKARLRDAMEHGCLGLSSGLIYVPSVYADTEELIELCRVIRPYGGVYATHMRSESDHVVEAVREAIAIAKAADVPLVISHHKVCGKRNWGASRETLRLIHEAIDGGMRIMLDQYPYTASQTGLCQCMPPKYFAEGPAVFAKLLRDPDVRAKVKAEMTEEPPQYNSSYQNAGGFGGILVLSCPGAPEAEGLTVREYAQKLGRDEFEVYFDMMADGCVGALDGPTHPRAYGSLVRALCTFSKQRGLVSFEEAIRKETGLTAARWGLAGKGRIAEGMDADLVLMDVDKLQDNADFMHPRALCSGIEKVLVGGVVAYENGRLTGANPGRCVLRQ